MLNQRTMKKDGTTGIMNKLTAIKELTAVMVNLIPQFAEAMGFEGDDLVTMVRFVDLQTPPTFPIMQAGDAILSWGAVRSLISTEPAPWFWNNISVNPETGVCTAWDETGANEINQYTEYKDAVLAILQYAESLGE